MKSKKSNQTKSGKKSFGDKKNAPTTTKRKRLTFEPEKETNNFLSSQNYGVRVYDLEAKKSLEEIIKKSKLKAKYNEEARNYTELIEDLEFPIATNSMSLCSDGKFLWASGIYPPQIHCYELDQLTMKMSRHVEKEVLKLLPLSSDFRKLILLTVDRTVEIHAHFGSYYKFRLPVVGRDMIYHSSTAEMLFTGSSNEIYRFNLEEGIFKKSYECLNETTNGINTISLNPIHDFITVGCDNGYIECIDHRQKKHIGILNVCENIEKYDNTISSGNEITSLCFDNDGIKLGCGTINGQVALFDIRKNTPILVKDHFYEEPIKKISFFNENVISSDTKVIKIWNKSSGDIYTNLEPPSKINDFLHFPNSGMIFVGGERQKIKPYYIPSLGPAPKWCSFVDNITEELEEIKKQTIFQDYKFITFNELEELNLTDLIGTDLLRPHLHGFFMKINLYKQAINLNKEKNKKKKIKKDIIQDGQDEKENKKENKKDKYEKEQNEKEDDIHFDERFSEMLNNPDFLKNEQDDIIE